MAMYPGFGALTAYAQSNPQGATVAGCILGLGVLACRLLSSKRAQQSAAAVHQVVAQVQVSDAGHTCTLIGEKSTKLTDFGHEIAAKVSQAEITKLVLDFGAVESGFTKPAIEQLCARFPKLTHVHFTVRAAFQSGWLTGVPKHIAVVPKAI